MRFIGLDVGTKRVGIAISDKTNTIASPLKVIEFHDINKCIKEINEIIIANDITEVIIGLPKNMDNSLGFASERTMKFKSELENIVDTKVSLIDERLTTVEAENILINNDYRRDKRKKNIDTVAAVLILETYLKGRKNKNE